MAEAVNGNLGCEEFGRGVPVSDTGLLDQDALWDVVAAEHPDLDAEREAEEQAARDFENADPFVHLQAHVLVENQLHADEPPQVRKTLHALRDTGLQRHQAVHAIASHAYELILLPMGANPIQNERQYVDRLKQLVRHPEFVAGS